jgi:hypothetical protein
LDSKDRIEVGYVVPKKSGEQYSMMDLTKALYRIDNAPLLRNDFALRIMPSRCLPLDARDDSCCAHDS